MGKPRLNPWPFCANDGTCSCAKFKDDPEGCEQRKERGVKPPVVTVLDEDSPLWLVNEQIKGLLEGDGAGEDHEDVLAFLSATGLPESTVKRVHKAIVRAETVPMKYRRMAFNARLQEENAQLAALVEALKPDAEKWRERERKIAELKARGFLRSPLRATKGGDGNEQA